MTRTLASRIGARPAAVWAVKHIVSPIDRFVVRASGGRLRPPSALAVPTLLLTTVGHRSGRERTIPLVYITSGDGFVVGNARPAGERRNPWVANLRAAGSGTVRVGRRTIPVDVRELDEPEVASYWPMLVEAWPAFAEHFAATGERAVFLLTPRH